jgi:hypothetical protein
MRHGEGFGPGRQPGSRLNATELIGKNRNCTMAGDRASCRQESKVAWRASGRQVGFSPREALDTGRPPDRCRHSVLTSHPHETPSILCSLFAGAKVAVFQGRRFDMMTTLHEKAWLSRLLRAQRGIAAGVTRLSRRREGMAIRNFDFEPAGEAGPNPWETGRGISPER